MGFFGIIKYMNKTKLSEISIEGIKSGELKDLIPELYELEKIIENNKWHNNDNVLNHTISTLVELERLYGSLDKKAQEYLDEEIDVYSRRKLLFLATLFHDIGKEQDNSKGHEEKGAIILVTILERFDLSEKEKHFVIKIVKNHGVVHHILKTPDENSEQKIEEFNKENPHIFLESVLLAIADMMGSQLKNSSPDEFKYRIDFLTRILN